MVPLNKNNEAARKKQLTIILDLIAKIGARELDDEYDAFQSLVEERLYSAKFGNSLMSMMPFSL